MTLLHEKPKFLNFADGKLNNADKILTYASYVFYGTFASAYSQANVAEGGDVLASDKVERGGVLV